MHDQLEIFRIFKEIESLLKRIKQIQAEIDQENTRITHLAAKIQENQDELSELMSENQTLEQLGVSLAAQESQLSQKLAKYENDLKMASDQNTANKLTEQVNLYKHELNDTQERAFTALSRQEEIAQLSLDLNTFISGASETLLEIKQEVQEFTLKSQKEMQNLKQRIELHHSEFSSDATTVWEKLKKRGHIERADFLARIDGANCDRCHCSLIRTDIDDVEVHKRIKYCNTCYRLLLPHSA
jgi:predicted  nucleic acid-binding Zn-ribbon protein